MSLACHNAALLNVKLGRWADAQELVDEGIEFTKASDLEGHAERTCRKDMEFLKCGPCQIGGIGNIRKRSKRDIDEFAFARNLASDPWRE